MGNVQCSRDGASIEWTWDLLGEGASRYAFPCKVIRGNYCGFPAGSELVLKVVKPEAYHQGVRITEKDVKAAQMAADYADKFNMKGISTKAVHFRTVAVTYAEGEKVNRCLQLRVRNGDTMLLEKKIHGDWEKFNSNSGWSMGRILPDAFSHWTWVESGGKHLVCDLQGHRGRPGGPHWGSSVDYYLFTDPVVLSQRVGTFGCTDLGPKGMENWFLHHRCNRLCAALGIQNRVPKKAAHFACHRRTSYA